MESKEILKQVIIGMVAAVATFAIMAIACVILHIIMP